MSGNCKISGTEIRALSGLLDPEEAIQPCRDLNRDQINAGLQGLIVFVNTGQRAGLTRALDVFKHLQGNNPTFDGSPGPPGCELAGVGDA